MKCFKEQTQICSKCKTTSTAATVILLASWAVIDRLECLLRGRGGWGVWNVELLLERASPATQADRQRVRWSASCVDSEGVKTLSVILPKIFSRKQNFQCLQNRGRWFSRSSPPLSAPARVYRTRRTLTQTPPSLPRWILGFCTTTECCLKGVRSLGRNAKAHFHRGKLGVVCAILTHARYHR